MTGAVGVVSEDGRRPFFKVYRIPDQAGAASRLALKWIGWELGEKRVVRFGDLPEFERRFTVMATGDDEEAVRQCLTPALRQGLAESRFWILLAGGGTLAIHDPRLAVARGPAKMRLLQDSVEEAVRLSGVLKPLARRSQRS